MSDKALSVHSPLSPPESQIRYPVGLSRAAVLSALLSLSCFTVRLAADEVRIQNGDHYAGQVLSLTTNRLVLQSAALGKVTLARYQVTSITLAAWATNKTGSARSTGSAGDEVWMQNGDRVAGQVLSLNTNALVLQSPVLGRISLPRCEVASITLSSVVTNKAGLSLSAAPPDLQPVSPDGQPGQPAGLGDSLRQLSLSGNTLSDLKNQYLNNAGPEANQKFNDLVAGLMSGKLGVNDIRAQAQSVAAQARALKRDLGNDPSADALDSYLEILDSFLQQTAPASGKISTPAK